MRTFRKLICTLVVVLTAVIGYLGVLPGNAHARDPFSWPMVGGEWTTNRGVAILRQNHNGTYGRRIVTGSFMGPYGLVRLNGQFWNDSRLVLQVNGVRYDGTLDLKVEPPDSSGHRVMTGWVKLNGLLPIRWTWSQP